MTDDDRRQRPVSSRFGAGTRGIVIGGQRDGPIVAEGDAQVTVIGSQQINPGAARRKSSAGWNRAFEEGSTAIKEPQLSENASVEVNDPVPPEKKPVRVPMLAFMPVPGAEQNEVLALGTLVLATMTYHQNFVAAVHLFESTMQWEQQPGNDDAARSVLHQWRLIAARDGAMTIFHLGKAIDHVKKAVLGCPTLSVKTDHSNLAAARNLFRQKFPRFEEMRNAVAHKSELIRNSTHWKKNATAGLMQQDSLNGRTYIATREGKTLSYEISISTSNQISDVLNIFYWAFRDAH